MAQFTPEQIEEFLQQFFDVVGTRQYVGARYVPLFGRRGEQSIEWDNTAPYEPLTVVSYQGNSFMSRQYVPTGIEIANEDFWACTGNYNAQVEAYRREVLALSDVVDTKTTSFNTVSDMTSSNILKDGFICTTSGFNSIGDGGGGTYYISSDGEANGMDIISCGSLNAHLVIGESLSIKQLGASGSGSQNATEFFNRAIALNVKRIIIPSGVYVVDSIDISREMDIVGYGYPTLKVSETTEENFFTVSGYNVTVSNIRLDGNNRQGSSIVGLAIDHTGKQYDHYCVIENVKVENFSGHGMTTKNTRELKAGKVFVQGCGGDGFNISGTDQVFNECVAAGCNGTGFMVQGNQIKVSLSKAFYCNVGFSMGNGSSSHNTRQSGFFQCEAQNNKLEGYVVIFCNGCTIQGCWSNDNNTVEQENDVYEIRMGNYVQKTLIQVQILRDPESPIPHTAGCITGTSLTTHYGNTIDITSWYNAFPFCSDNFPCFCDNVVRFNGKEYPNGIIYENSMMNIDRTTGLPADWSFEGATPTFTGIDDGFYTIEISGSQYNAIRSPRVTMPNIKEGAKISVEFEYMGTSDSFDARIDVRDSSQTTHQISPTWVKQNNGRYIKVSSFPIQLSSTDVDIRFNCIGGGTILKKQFRNFKIRVLD